MSILSDNDIIKRLKKDLTIEYDDELNIQPASVDLHLGKELKNLDSNSFFLNENVSYTLEPDEFILASTLEHIEIPCDLVGIVDGKSSLGRLGITIHVTAGYIDPGFKGNITLEIKNLSDQPFQLVYGMSICQLVLETLTSTPEHVYGDAELNSHYQGSKGTVLSKYEK